MTQKFVMGSPLYRQEQALRRQGISLSRQTMSNWILRAAEDYLTPVYEQMHKELLGRAVLHADETTLQVLHEPDKSLRVRAICGLYRTSGDTDKPIVLYEYQPGRGARHPKAFLTGFRGYLHTDGYAGYHNLRMKSPWLAGWAHARRKFDEAVKSLPKGRQKVVPPRRAWLIAISCLNWRIRSAAFLQKNDTSSGWNRQTCSGRFIGMGKYQNGSAEVCPGQSIYLSEGAMAVPGQLSAGRQIGDFQ